MDAIGNPLVNPVSYFDIVLVWQFSKFGAKFGANGMGVSLMHFPEKRVLIEGSHAACCVLWRVGERERERERERNETNPK
jgi:hypothetical protein